MGKNTELAFSHHLKIPIVDNLIDFSESGNLENIYQIAIKQSPKGYPIMLSAKLIKAEPCAVMKYPQNSFT